MLTRTIARCAALSAGRRLKQFNRQLPHCRTVQNRLLLKILRANQASDFGRRHVFARLGSYADFSHALPLANYAYFTPYIDRCRRGETAALLAPRKNCSCSP